MNPRDISLSRISIPAEVWRVTKEIAPRVTWGTIGAVYAGSVIAAMASDIKTTGKKLDLLEGPKVVAACNKGPAENWTGCMQERFPDHIVTELPDGTGVVISRTWSHITCRRGDNGPEPCL